MTYRYIYKITCTKGDFKNKFYYGQHTTKKLNDGYKGSGTKLCNYYKKYPNDYIKEIISFHATQEDLNKAEYDIIKPFLNDSMCLNLRDGGNQGEVSEEHKKKLSMSHIGQITWMKGKHHKEKTKQILSNYFKNKPNIKNKGSNNGMYGKPAPNRTKVIQYDFYGNIINEWDSMKQIGHTLHISLQKVIDCCKGRRDSYKEYIWQYA